MTPFNEILRSSIRTAGMNQSQFSKKIGRATGVVTVLLQGKLAPRLDELEPWAKILGLSEAETHEFVRAGQKAKLLAKADLAPLAPLLDRLYELEVEGSQQ